MARCSHKPLFFKRRFCLGTIYENFFYKKQTFQITIFEGQIWPKSHQLLNTVMISWFNEYNIHAYTVKECRKKNILLAHYVIWYIYHLSSSRVKGDSSTSGVALSPLTREDVASNDYIVLTGTCILEQKNRKYH